MGKVNLSMVLAVWVWASVLSGCGSVTTPRVVGAADTASTPDTAEDAETDTAADPDTAEPDDAADSTPGTPAMPVLGAQLDRAGRPLVKELLFHAFDPYAAGRDAARDGWDRNGDPASWTAYASELVQGLSVFDSIDTVCGNQWAADTAQVAPSRYSALASLLADDRLVVDTAAESCGVYMAVELNAVGTATPDCGGRRLDVDVVDATYTLLITGGLDSSVGDGVAAGAEAAGTTFPYLAPPL